MRNVGKQREMLKNARFSHVFHGGIGVSTFIP